VDDSARLPVREGDVLAGKYRLDKLLGIGEMSAVLRATHLELEQEVAIKLLRPEQLSRPEAVKRFLREARAAVRLRSSNVARVLDVGTAEVNELAIPFMVMELLAGSDFETLLEERGRFSAEEAADYLLQACDAVGEAHALGIIHRALEPANLFLTTRRDGTPLVKLLDFGISKMQRPLDGKKISQEQAFTGSPAYMSPEQVRSTKDVDQRTDIWSLGAILYELLTGKKPWAGETSAVTFAMILNDPPPPMRAAAPDVPEGLEAIALRCLEKEATARFQSVGELANVLAPFAGRRAEVPLTAVDSPSGPPSGRSSAIPALSSTGPLSPKPPPWWHLPAILGGIVVAVAIVVLLAVASRDKPDSPPPAAAVSVLPPPAASAVPVASTGASGTSQWRSRTSPPPTPRAGEDPGPTSTHR